jgi:threonine dehydrogenase-like Zn-dependent dehydrogenase
MKALTYHAPKDIRFESIPDAKVTKPHAALVRVKACGICGSDLHIYQGHGFSEDIGFCVGHEAVGEIVEIGSSVETLKVGDQVMISAAVGCGRCAACRAGDAVRCADNATGCYGLSHALPGCQAEAVMVPHADQNAAIIPEGLSSDQALMLTDNLPTAYLGALNADIRPGGTVAVVGLGRPCSRVITSMASQTVPIVAEASTRPATLWCRAVHFSARSAWSMSRARPRASFRSLVSRLRM